MLMTLSPEFERLLFRLNDIGVSLSYEQNLERLLDKILYEARQLTRAEAGTLYVREGDYLCMRVVQNDRMTPTEANPTVTGGSMRRLRAERIPLNTRSLAGYVAVTGKILNIPDCENIPPAAEYKHLEGIDASIGYRCRSMVVVPMKDPQGSQVGVLQLINAVTEGGTLTFFDRRVNSLLHSIASQAAVAIRNARLTLELKDAYLEVIHRLSVAAEYRDQETAIHLRRMSNYSAILAEQMGLPEESVEMVLYGSPMHDVGKIGISDRILLKPGKFTEAERKEMERHPIIGSQILGGSGSEVLQWSERIALTHHEKFDGTGYPRRLKGEEIPLEGRIVSLADVFDALTSERCYKPPFSVDRAVEMIRQGRGTAFDPLVVDAFDKCLPLFLQVRDEMARMDKKLPSASGIWSAVRGFARQNTKK